jgi:hypothetical protein
MPDQEKDTQKERDQEQDIDPRDLAIIKTSTVFQPDALDICKSAYVLGRARGIMDATEMLRRATEMLRREAGK